MSEKSRIHDKLRTERTGIERGRAFSTAHAGYLRRELILSEGLDTAPRGQWRRLRLRCRETQYKRNRERRLRYPYARERAAQQQRRVQTRVNQT